MKSIKYSWIIYVQYCQNNLLFKDKKNVKEWKKKKTNRSNEFHNSQSLVPEDLSISRVASIAWDQWSTHIAMPLVTQLREGIHPLLFPTDLSVNPICSEDRAHTKLLSPSKSLLSQSMISSGSSDSGGYTCSAPDCGRVYKLKSSLRNHQKWECGKDPQFQCPFCVYRAKQKMHIGRHMERMHKNNTAMLKAAAAVVAASASVANAIKQEDNNSSESIVSENNWWEWTCRKRKYYIRHSSA